MALRSLLAARSRAAALALGSATDLARETAAIVLPKDGLWMLPWVVDMARAVRKTILSNLIWAFGYNVIALNSCRAGRFAADPRGWGHGGFERPRRGEFAAA